MYAYVVNPVLHIECMVPGSPVIYVQYNRTCSVRFVSARDCAADVGAVRQETAAVGDDRLTGDRDGEVTTISI